MNTFKFHTHELRMEESGGEPWFVAADVCRCIGLTVHNAHTHVRDLLSKEKRLACASSNSTKGTRTVLMISESGLYKLLLRARRRKPEVGIFQDWVTRDVLPAIRRTGGYLLNEHARDTAHADELSAIPLQPELLAVFQRQNELLERIAKSLDGLGEGWGGGREAQAQPTDSFDREFYSAREVVTKLRLAGACPTAREFTSISIRIGQRLSELARQMKAEVRMDTRFQFPTKLYPRAVVEAFARLT